MPSGLYIRTKPLSPKQLEALVKGRKLPKTEKQIENTRRMGLNNKGKSHPSSLNANTIVEHHNDLCHGAKDPNDVTYMPHSEHVSLHHNLRVQNGTHPFLPNNRTDAMK
jgi:hypothetical protein